MRLFPIALLVGCCAPALAQQPKLPDLTSEMVSKDARLSTKVTLSARNKTIGEVLADLSKQTGIKLSAREDDLGALERLAIFAKDVPVHKILNGIWSTFSFKGGEWEWRRFRDGEKFRYVLEQPDAAKRLRLAIKESVQKHLEDGIERLIRALDASDEEKDAALLEMYGESEGNFKKYNAFPKDRVWADVRLLRDLLTPAERRDLYEGNFKLTIPFDKLNSSQQSHYLSANEEINKLVQGKGSSRYPPPEDVMIQGRKVRGLPGVQVDVSNATSAVPALGGSPYPYFRYRETIKRAWIRPDELQTSPADQIDIDAPGIREKLAPSTAEPGTLEAVSANLLDQFEVISIATNSPVIMRLPYLPYRVSFRGTSKTLPDLWKQLWNQDMLIKWRDGVLLTLNYSWPLEDAPVSPAIIARLRKSAKPGEILPLKDIGFVAAMLTKDQILTLAREFPTMRGVAESRLWLSMLEVNPGLAAELSRPEGALLNPSLALSLTPLLPSDGRTAVRSGQVRCARLLVQSPPGVKNARSVRLLLLGLRGEVVREWGYGDVRQPSDDDEIPRPSGKLGVPRKPK